MMTDCRWWLSLLSNSRDMNCQGWDDWQWAGAAAAEDAIWQPFSDFADDATHSWNVETSANERSFRESREMFFFLNIKFIISNS
jgi:hypothetical protein